MADRPWTELYVSFCMKKYTPPCLDILHAAVPAPCMDLRPKLESTYALLFLCTYALLFLCTYTLSNYHSCVRTHYHSCVHFHGILIALCYVGRMGAV